MLSVAAVILTDASRTKFDGVDLNERAAHVAHRAGIFDVHFAGAASPSEEVLARLRSAGWRFTVSVAEGRPLEAAPLAQTVVVLPARTVIEPVALVSLLREAAATPLAPALVVTPDERRKSHELRLSDGVVASVMGDGNARSTGIAVLPEESLARVRRVWDYDDAIHRLAKAGTLRALETTDWFCARVDRKADLKSLERAYRERIGGSEGLVARSVKAFAALMADWWTDTPLTGRSPARA